MAHTSLSRFCCTLFFLCSAIHLQAAYNPLVIPDTLSGKNFSLSIRDTFAQYRSGNQTITGGINGATFWGPTLFLNKGDTIHMTVKNGLNDSTTIHWHGMHLPAVMDGGPHQVIPPGTVWQPYWKVTNQAATYWYHPHLHEMTQEHLTKGIGGFIIVRDSEEAALKLPRSYGVDDIPLVLTSRRFDNANQFVTTNIAYGDFMLSNGVLNAQVTLPKQLVRVRILNAEIERAYILGFSDNRKFYLIATDGGLVNTPIECTRIKMGVGERVEILVDLSADAVGSSFDMKAFNSGQAFGFPGGEPGTNGPLGSLLNNVDFVVLHVNVGATTSNAVTAVPAQLAHNSYWTATDAAVKKTVAVTGGTPGTDFTLDNFAFALNRINKTVKLNDVEQWTITNNQVFSHAFHIHDVEFAIVARNGNASAVAAYEKGWKDVVYLPKGESVSFVAKFDDYSDSTHPFMYHCHFSNHEDGGMMGQFVVVGTPAATLSLTPTTLRLGSASNSAKSVDLTSTITWSLSIDSTWLHASKSSGTGNASITLTADENKTTAERSTVVRVSGPGVTTQLITVTQDGAGPALTLSPTLLSLNAVAAVDELLLTSNTAWTLHCDQPWCTLTPDSGSGSARIRVEASTNVTQSMRIAVVSATAAGVSPQSVNIRQYFLSSVPMSETTSDEYTITPQPVATRLMITLAHPENPVYYLTICNVNGRAVMMLPKPEVEKGIDVSALAAGTYIARIVDERSKSVRSLRFIKQ